MNGWPVITEPELLARLALSDEEFNDFVLEVAAQLAARQYGPEALAFALGYPWSRPERSYVLTGSRVELLDELDPAARAAVLARCIATGSARERTPLLAFGSNGAPSALERKFAHFPDEDDRTVVVVAGRLHDFDVGAAAQPTVYGSLPATLFASPGTAVRAAVLWVTSAQFTQLAWSEISYRLGRLEARFEADAPAHSFDGVLGFASRFGAFSPEGRPVALAAIPASGRTATAMTQEELLDTAAVLALGPQARAADLVRGIYEDMPAMMPRLAATVRRAATPFRSDRWTPFRSPPPTSYPEATGFGR